MTCYLRPFVNKLLLVVLTFYQVGSLILSGVFFDSSLSSVKALVLILGTFCVISSRVDGRDSGSATW